MKTTTQQTQADGFKAAAAASAQAEIERKQAARPPRSFVEKMACKLSAEELNERGAAIADKYEEAEKLEDVRKIVNDGYKARIALVEQSIRELAGTLKSKTEMRDVELLEEFVFQTNTVRIVRADTKELVRTRAMTKNERQEELPLPKTENATKAATSDREPSSENGTAITAPQTLLDNASADDGDQASAVDEGRKSRNKRVRRGRK